MPKESINTIIFIMTSIFLFMLLFAFFTAKRDSNIEEFFQTGTCKNIVNAKN